MGSSGWVEFSTLDLKTDKLTSLLESGQTITSAISSFCDGLSTALKVLSTFIIEDTNAIRAASNALVNSIEASLTDILQNNVAMAVHVNLEWDPTWKYERGPNDDATHVPDWKNDGRFPWTARGMQSWLLDIAASAYDETDPFRPLTDEETSVGGFIFVTGSSSFSDLEHLRALFDVFKSPTDFKEALDMAPLDEIDVSLRPLTRLGPAITSSFMRSVVSDPSGQGQSILEKITNTTVTDFAPIRGNYPKWTSVQTAALLPVVKDIVAALQQFMDNLRPAADMGDMLSELADALARRATMLSDLATKLGEILAALEALLAILDGGYFIWVPMTTGGVSGFINNALAADNLPEFGDDGVVSGVVAICTADDPLNHLQAFWELLGADVDALQTSTSQKTQNIEDAFSGVFP